jgi:formate dehydrogenase major subunit
MATKQDIEGRADFLESVAAGNDRNLSCRDDGLRLGLRAFCGLLDGLRFHGGRRKEKVMSDLTRRQFLKVTGMSLVGSSLAVMGFAPGPALAEVREYKLTRATETRNTCPYCSVACGVLMYGLGDAAKNAQPSIFHIEGDPDHPVNRGTLCPKGAGLIDFIHSESRLKYPEYRAPGSDRWQRMTWDDALDRISKLMKQDRDANFVAKTPEGLTVNRWLTTGMLAASASSNEVGYLTHKVARSLGLLAFDNQARV